jgi:hypothetical protein
MLPRLSLMMRLALIGLMLGLAGCGVESGPQGPETDDSGYRDAKQLENQGRMDEALAAYLKVIARRGEDSSPESHLDAAGIYLNYVKDPIYAIYHFRKYLELEPNSREAQAVKGQIEAARREFARTIPGWQPTDGQMPVVSLNDDGDSLRRENAELKAELQTLRTSQGLPPLTHTSTDTTAADPAGADQGVQSTPVRIAPMDQPPIQPIAQTDQPPPIQPDTPAAPPPAKPAPAAHTYTVVKGDSFMVIARKLYKNPSRYREIEAANPGVTALKPGMQIRLP